MVVRLWAGGGARADLVQPDPKLPPAFAAAIGSHAAGTVSTAGAGVDGLWLRAGLCPGGAKCARALRVCDWGQRGANRHVGSCPSGAREVEAGISAAVSGAACGGGPTGD